MAAPADLAKWVIIEWSAVRTGHAHFTTLAQTLHLLANRVERFQLQPLQTTKITKLARFCTWESGKTMVTLTADTNKQPPYRQCNCSPSNGSRFHASGQAKLERIWLVYRERHLFPLDRCKYCQLCADSCWTECTGHWFGCTKLSDMPIRFRPNKLVGMHSKR